jgi:hypothetical protein
MVDNARISDHSDVLDQALKLAGFIRRPDKVASTALTAEGHLAVQAAPTTPGTRQTLLVTDAHGAVSFHLPAVQPESDLEATEPSGRGFVVPSERLADIASAAAAESAGIEPGTVGLPVLDILEHSIGDEVGGEFVHAYEGFELNVRPYRVRAVVSSDGNFVAGPDVSDWSALTTGDALLFVHGIFSSSDDTFRALPAGTIDRFLTRYRNRVFCFDHPTVSVSPEDNVKWLLQQIPPARN